MTDIYYSYNNIIPYISIFSITYFVWDLLFIIYTGKIKECQEPLGTQSYDKCCNNYSNTKPKHTGTSHIAIMPDSLISEKCIRCRMARFKRFKDFHRLYLFYNYGTSYHTQQGLSSTLFCGGSVYSIPIFTWGVFF